MVGDLGKLLEVIRQRLPEMNGINLATSLHRVAKLTSTGKPFNIENIKNNEVFKNLVAAIETHLLNHSCRTGSLSQASAARDDMPVQCMSIVTWSCATLQLRREALFDVVAEISATRLAELQPYEMSNLLWAFAKLSVPAQEVFTNATWFLNSRTWGEYKVQSLSIAVWSLATLGMPCPIVFNSVAQELLARVDEAKPTDIANTVWAFAQMQCPDYGLFQAYGDAACNAQTFDGFTPQELSTIVWSFAVAEVHHGALFGRTQAFFAKKRQELTPQTVAHVLWTFATLGLSSGSAMFTSLFGFAVAHVEDFTVQELSAISCSAAQVKPELSKYFAMASQGSLRGFDGFSPQELAGFAMALAMVDVEEMFVFKELMEECILQLFHFQPSSLSTLLQAASIASWNPSFVERRGEVNDYISTISTHVATRIDEFSQGELHEVSAVLKPFLCGPSAYSFNAATQLAKVVYDELYGRTCSTSVDSELKILNIESCVSTSASEDANSEDLEAATGDEMCWTSSTENVTSVVGVSKTKATRPPNCESSRQDRINSSDGISTSSVSSFEIGRREEDAPIKVYLDKEPLRVPLPGGVSVGPSSANAGTSYCSARCLPKTVEAVRAPPGLALPSTTAGMPQLLETIGSGQLKELPGVDGRVPQPVDFGALSSSAVHGTGAVTVGAYTRSFSGRVMLKRVAKEESALVAGGQPHRHVLRPLGRLEDDVAPEGYGAVVYPYCVNGSLLDWATARAKVGRPLNQEEVARTAIGILLGVEAIMHGATDVNVAVQMDEVFIDGAEQARLRPLRPGRKGRWSSCQAGLKWLAPEEAAGLPLLAKNGSDFWKVIAYRLGLVMYCLCADNGAAMDDPYPGTTAEQVLGSLLRESMGNGHRLRPQMSRFRGSQGLKELVTGCLRMDPNSQSPPDRNTVFAKLDALVQASRRQ
eukprot:TRINITY_DN26133_c0_g2_i2.p1 TRINITY_DN26133_c0_g2~~TRINITY_DN26133_c0_g2_i2.p1  ORF type:complete len:1005 (+),score=191.25 TRINITY_DN26133_c0_g2_i2:222-3017(+)